MHNAYGICTGWPIKWVLRNFVIKPKLSVVEQWNKNQNIALSLTWTSIHYLVLKFPLFAAQQSSNRWVKFATVRWNISEGMEAIASSTAHKPPNIVADHKLSFHWSQTSIPLITNLHWSSSVPFHWSQTSVQLITNLRCCRDKVHRREWAKMILHFHHL